MSINLAFEDQSVSPETSLPIGLKQEDEGDFEVK